METGDKYRDVTYNISNLKDVELSVHEIYHLKALITLKQVNTSVVERKHRSGVVNFHCIQIILVMRMWFYFGDD